MMDIKIELKFDYIPYVVRWTCSKYINKVAIKRSYEIRADHSAYSNVIYYKKEP